MSTEVSLRCRCGELRGVARDVSPPTVNRVVCYCDDCQTFAHFLERPDVMDAAGGTDIVQLAPSRVRITDGATSLRGVRLSPKGLFRWYAGCCRTPIGNSVPSLPFIGLVRVMFEPQVGGRSLDEVLGAPRGGIQARFATGSAPPGAHPKVPLGLMLRTVRLLATWKLTGNGSPSPFFDRGDRPVVEPEVLTRERRAELRPPG